MKAISSVSSFYAKEETADAIATGKTSTVLPNYNYGNNDHNNWISGMVYLARKFIDIMFRNILNSSLDFSIILLNIIPFSV